MKQMRKLQRSKGICIILINIRGNYHMNETTDTAKFKLLKRLISLIKRHKIVLILALPFLALDFATRSIGYKTTFFHMYSIRPILFTLSFIMLFLAFILCLKSIIGKIIYWVLFGLFFALYLTHGIYFSMTNFFFNFSLLELAGEGSSYIWETIVHANPIVYILAVLMLGLAIFSFRFIPKREKSDIKHLTIVMLVFIVVYALLPLTLGTANTTLKWNSFNRPRNVYNDFSDSNKCMKMCGLYQYSVRNMYVAFLRPEEKISNEDKQFLTDIYSSEDTRTPNEYTGIFKGKNVIFLQLEGMDKWLFNEKDTPNLYGLLDHAINFDNHYSMYTGGGSTFNSEFSVNTGFTTPVSYNRNVYSFNVNTFNNSLARIFKKNNYNVNAFHMNTSDFYSRGINYKSWGYDNYYGLLDIQSYDNHNYEFDRELINNKTFYNKMFQQEGNFLNYIITYSPHTPFSSEMGVAYLLLKEKYGKGNIPELSEEECARVQIHETDNMAGLLIQALKDNGLYDNTVIVAYADHYLYTLNDKSILDKYKNTENNLINNTPFFIWSSDLDKTEFTAATAQLNILPTVLNLFGMDYNSNNYIGKDALSPDYDPCVFFSDYSWYDGNVYVEDNKITNNGVMDDQLLQEKSQKIHDMIRKNDLTLKYDFLKNGLPTK